MQLTKAFTIRLDRVPHPVGPTRPGARAGLAVPAATGTAPEGTILVLGGTGATGRRVVERLAARGVAVRVGSRGSAPSLDWEDQATWGPALCGVDRVFLAFGAELAAPGGVERVCLFTALAVELGVRRLVLSTPHGDAEARCAEAVIRGASAEWTILRAGRSRRTCDAGCLRDAPPDGAAALPADEVVEPLVATGDVADAAVAALTADGHAGRVYELIDDVR